MQLCARNDEHHLEKLKRRAQLLKRPSQLLNARA
jgi:hypothetical protein